MRSVEKDAFHSLISEVSLDPDRQNDHVFLDMAKQNGGELSAHQFVAKSADQCDCRFSRAVVSPQLLGDGLRQIEPQANCLFTSRYCFLSLQVIFDF